MVLNYVPKLYPPVSAERLESYRGEPITDDLTMIVNYLWNTALSEALYPSLQGLEVTLRKSLHGALSRRYGTPAWYDYPECLELLEQQKIIEAKIEIPNR